MSRPEVLISTGAYTGRLNGLNHRLTMEYAAELDCDGFEFMLSSRWMDGAIDNIAKEYKAAGFKIVSIHAVKDMGGLIGSPDNAAFEICKLQFTKNCEIAEYVGASKIIAHIWGPPDSDKHMDLIAERCLILNEISKNHGLDFLPENTACYSSPLKNLEMICGQIAGLGITIDTRQAQFHSELAQTVQSKIFTGNMRHIHINDYSGGYMQWDHLYPIPPLGRGDVDFDMFFAALKGINYSDTITLESPSMREMGVDVETLNRGIAFIRERL